MNEVLEPVPRAKVALAAALKEALRTTPLAKVTVSGLAAAAGVSRQAFYSHFSGTYDLAAWVFADDVADHLMSHTGHDEWPDAFCDLLVYIRAHQEEAQAVVQSLKHGEMDRFYFQQFQVMMEIIVAEMEGDLVLNPDDRSFIVDHFALIGVGHLMRWMDTGMAENPYVLVERMEFMMQGDVRRSLERFATRA